MKKLLKSVAALSLSAMMLLSPGVLAEEDEEESNVVELTTVVQEYEGKQIVLKTAGLDILEQDGYKFKDLNKNGELDPYEDWRLTPEERTEDLLSRMSDKNKAAQMAHMTLVTLKESWFSDLDIGFALTQSKLRYRPLHFSKHSKYSFLPERMVTDLSSQFVHMFQPYMM